MSSEKKTKRTRPKAKPREKITISITVKGKEKTKQVSPEIYAKMTGGKAHLTGHGFNLPTSASAIIDFDYLSNFGISIYDYLETGRIDKLLHNLNTGDYLFEIRAKQFPFFDDFVSGKEKGIRATLIHSQVPVIFETFIEFPFPEEIHATDEMWQEIERMIIYLKVLKFNSRENLNPNETTIEFRIENLHLDSKGISLKASVQQLEEIPSVDLVRNSVIAALREGLRYAFHPVEAVDNKISGYGFIEGEGGYWNIPQTSLVFNYKHDGTTNHYWNLDTGWETIPIFCDMFAPYSRNERDYIVEEELAQSWTGVGRDAMFEPTSTEEDRLDFIRQISTKFHEIGLVDIDFIGNERVVTLTPFGREFYKQLLAFTIADEKGRRVLPQDKGLTVYNIPFKQRTKQIAVMQRLPNNPKFKHSWEGAVRQWMLQSNEEEFKIKCETLKPYFYPIGRADLEAILKDSSKAKDDRFRLQVESIQRDVAEWYVQTLSPSKLDEYYQYQGGGLNP
jgi:hypothetical protein